jgi:chromate reductase, NAD(P)H dehydrogenase (quinone)
MSASSTVKVVAMSGSLRKASYNTAALRAAKELAPDGMSIDIADVSQLPLYNEDVKAQGFPPPAQALRAQIAAADALLFATPEYNYSLPGLLKNAIDWASRPPDVPMLGKPVAMLGASPGILGTARAQYHLRQICVFLDMHPVNKPEVFIAQAASKFDAEGRLTDQMARDLIGQLLTALRDWTLKLRQK